jgi:hypothetical protein
VLPSSTAVSHHDPSACSVLTHFTDKPEPWDFKKQPAADIVVINIGTNDNNKANNVSTEAYIDAVTKIIQGVHGKWPNAQVIVMVSPSV